MWRGSSNASPYAVRRVRIARVPLVVAMFAACAAMTTAGTLLAETYKWMDDKGVIHYTDKIPADQVNKAATVLDKQARPIKHIDAPLTPAQRAAQEAEQRRAQSVARGQEEAERQDRALMQSFTSIDEIELSKSRAVATIDGQLQSSQAYISQLQKRRADVEAKKTALGNKPVPDALERELDSIDTELKRQNELVAVHQQDRAQTVARYDAFTMRWRQLKTEADAKAASAAH